MQRWLTVLYEGLMQLALQIRVWIVAQVQSAVQVFIYLTEEIIDEYSAIQQINFLKLL